MRRRWAGRSRKKEDNERFVAVALDPNRFGLLTTLAGTPLALSDAMSLREYKPKRSFKRTPAPGPKVLRRRAGPLSFKNTPLVICITASAWSWMESLKAGPCRRGRRSIRRTNAWRCTSRIIQWPTAILRASSPKQRGTMDKSASRCGRTHPASLLSRNAHKKPHTVIKPAKSWASSNASGIIVSANIARIAPAATAVVPAITSGEKLRNTA